MQATAANFKVFQEKHRKILPRPTDAKFRPTNAMASFGISVHLAPEVSEFTKHRLHHLLPPIKTHRHNIRDGNKYEIPKVLSRTRKSFINWCLYNLQ